jgi:hypothetical protein
LFFIYHDLLWKKKIKASHRCYDGGQLSPFNVGTGRLDSLGIFFVDTKLCGDALLFWAEEEIAGD